MPLFFLTRVRRIFGVVAQLSGAAGVSLEYQGAQIAATGLHVLSKEKESNRDPKVEKPEEKKACSLAVLEINHQQKLWPDAFYSYFTEGG